MIVEMLKGVTSGEIEAVIERAKELGFDNLLNQGTDKTVIAILGSNTGQTTTDVFAVLPGVESVTRIMKPYKLASREFKADNTVVRVGNVEIGGKRLVIMAGPCAVESRQQLEAATQTIKSSGATILRGGAFKPRTSPFGFQGLEEAGLKLLADIKHQFNIPVVTEIVDPHAVGLVAQYADILQVGARNMQNFTLLTELGRIKHPVLLKRGLANTVTEWLTAADYVLAGGNIK